MTDNELHVEWEYRFQERLGMLCEDREPTDEQYAMARREADEIVAKLAGTRLVEIII